MTEKDKPRWFVVTGISALFDDQYQLINKIRDAAPNSEVSLRVNVDDFLAGDTPPKT